MVEIRLQGPLLDGDSITVTTEIADDGEEYLTGVVRAADRPEKRYTAVQDTYINGLMDKANKLASDGWRMLYLTATPMGHQVQYTAVMCRPPSPVSDFIPGGLTPSRASA